ncbi:fumarylacetoacetate hydrolase family protein [Oricola sp.]|uniref:fumarylacetoacetate hydrolase family protein n=1 Tax=Oricola sp. TaxID=1979950 RepID=UPI003BAC7A0D
MQSIVPSDGGVLVGRVWRPDVSGPSVVMCKDGRVLDITSKAAPTMRDLLEIDDPVGFLATVAGEDIGGLEEIAAASGAGGMVPEDAVSLLAPMDLQSVKACGVTFARSMIERVIEERAAGDPARAQAIRAKVSGIIGDSLRDLVPGSEQAARVKAALIDEGLWSQYLEVGIGPDAEVFSKAQPMSSVGWGAEIGLHPVSQWNNPEPEVVLAIDSRGRVKGATLGNDVNLRDVEGRSALLLGKAKDNNASSAVGPFIRLFDSEFGIDDVRAAELDLVVEGEDGFRLEGKSSMREISRDPLDLVAQTIGRHHQYPEGLVLYLGTLFAPIEDRDAPGQGFTHKRGDRVTISSARLGSLSNTVRLSTECPEWTFGPSALMRNLARRGLL